MSHPVTTFRKVHLGALGLLAVALPWSEFLISSAQLILVGNWLLEGVVHKDLGTKARRAFSNTTCLVFLSFFGLHLLGLLYTTDMAWGLDLCRILLPFLVLAPVLVSSPTLGEGEVRTMLALLAWSTVASTLACLLMGQHVMADGGYRELSIFISHIRLSLLLAFAGALFLLQWPRTTLMRAAHIAATVWCAWFIHLLSGISGVLALFGVGAYLLWRWSAGRGALVSTLVGAAIVGLVSAPVLLLRQITATTQQLDPVQLSALPQYSVGGEYYWHDLQRPMVENGYPVWVCGG